MPTFFTGPIVVSPVVLPRTSPLFGDVITTSLISATSQVIGGNTGFKINATSTVSGALSKARQDAIIAANILATSTVSGSLRRNHVITLTFSQHMQLS